MLTKADFINEIGKNIGDYPDVAPLYLAKDPRTLQLLDSMATMLAMFSSQVEVAMSEPFDKTRDSTVLADAALRGIIRKAVPGRVKLRIKNENTMPVTIEAGRTLLDSDGNRYVVTKPGAIPESVLAGSVYVPGEGYIEADQYTRQLLVHTAANSEDFYAIAIPAPEDNSYLSALSVSDGLGDYAYRGDFINAFPDDRIYTVEFDDRGAAYVRFGLLGVAGTRINAGDVINIDITRSVGRINPKLGSPFSFEYLFTTEGSGIDLAKVALEMNELLSAGENPVSLGKLRQLCKYPSIYDGSAVFLGEFEFLVRRKYPDIHFLSVWNEAVEEVARGAGSLDNINTLFVACFDATEEVLAQPTPTPVPPTEITALTAKQGLIKSTLLAADNSYRVRFLTPVIHEIAIAVTAKISTAHIVGSISAQIKQAIIAEFGKNSGNHASKPIQRLAYALLKEKIPELSAGNTYLKVDVTELTGAFRPELWRYATAASITVTITQANINLPGWGV